MRDSSSARREYSSASGGWIGICASRESNDIRRRPGRSEAQRQLHAAHTRRLPLPTHESDAALHEAALVGLFIRQVVDERFQLVAIAAGRPGGTCVPDRMRLLGQEWIVDDIEEHVVFPEPGNEQRQAAEIVEVETVAPV